MQARPLISLQKLAEYLSEKIFSKEHLNHEIAKLTNQLTYLEQKAKRFEALPHQIEASQKSIEQFKQNISALSSTEAKMIALKKRQEQSNKKLTTIENRLLALELNKSPPLQVKEEKYENKLKELELNLKKEQKKLTALQHKYKKTKQTLTNDEKEIFHLKQKIDQLKNGNKYEDEVRRFFFKTGMGEPEKQVVRHILKTFKRTKLEKLLFKDTTADIDEPVDETEDQLELKTQFIQLEERYGYFSSSNEAKNTAYERYQELVCPLVVARCYENNFAPDPAILEFAYHALVLFDNDKNQKDCSACIKKFDQFLNAHAYDEKKQPIHDALMHPIPIYKEHKFHLPEWRNLIHTSGPKALQLLRMAPDIEKYLKNTAPENFQHATEIALRVSYPNEAKDRKIAALAMRYFQPNEVFEKCLKIKESRKTKDNLPNIIIDGKTINIEEKHAKNKKAETKNCGGYYLVKLPIDDPHAYFLGHITDCCQSIGGHSEQCVIDGLIHPNNGFYVLLQAKHPTQESPISDNVINYKDFRIVGQGYAWLSKDTQSTSENNLTYDSWENLNNQHDEMIVAMLRKFADQVTSPPSPIFRVTIGRGGKTPKEFSDNNLLENPEVMKEGEQYSDSYSQSLVGSFYITELKELAKSLIPPDDLFVKSIHSRIIQMGCIEDYKSIKQDIIAMRELNEKTGMGPMQEIKRLDNLICKLFIGNELKQTEELFSRGRDLMFKRGYLAVKEKLQEILEHIPQTLEILQLLAAKDEPRPLFESFFSKDVASNNHSLFVKDLEYPPREFIEKIEKYGFSSALYEKISSDTNLFILYDDAFKIMKNKYEENREKSSLVKHREEFHQKIIHILCKGLSKDDAKDIHANFIVTKAIKNFYLKDIEKSSQEKLETLSVSMNELHHLNMQFKTLLLPKVHYELMKLINGVEFKVQLDKIKLMLNCLKDVPLNKQQKCFDVLNSEGDYVRTAIEEGNSEIADFLARNHPDLFLEAIDNPLSSALISPIREGKTEMIQVLAKHFPSILTKNEGCLAAELLHTAAGSNSSNMVRTLIESKVDVNHSTDYGIAAIHGLARNTNAKLENKKEILSILVNAKADLNKTDKNSGLSPVHFAVVSRQPHMIFELAKCKANLNLPDNEKLTPLARAAQSGFDECTIALLKCGVNFKEQPSESIDILNKHSPNLDYINYEVSEYLEEPIVERDQLLIGLCFYMRINREDKAILSHLKQFREEMKKLDDVVRLLIPIKREYKFEEIEKAIANEYKKLDVQVQKIEAQKHPSRSNYGKPPESDNEEPPESISSYQEILLKEIDRIKNSLSVPGLTFQFAGDDKKRELIARLDEVIEKLRNGITRSPS